ncbi:EamA-like transporter family protein [Marinomonas spartinae]|uniref:DMT family transporter n=1 Tax=Marinomonas spartinae TaxID=1792290 RepID=UPI0008090614|nr:DMT family transporter [Marinomonas spartinae]SBS39100.1 EamA-like transporter family protein [Marinomonas spartinae]
MPFAELSGLVAALCWTISSLMAPRLIHRFGTMRFNTIRITIASCLLILISLLGQRFDASLWQHSPLVILSGLLGIFLGDTMLFTAVHRLGPRRTGVLFATNAPMSIFLSWLFLNEALSLTQLLACGLVFSGVIIAILFGKRREQLHEWEQTKGKLSTGVLFALGGALGQACGALLSKPALLDGADPIAVSTVRVSAGAIALLLAYGLYYRHRRPASSLPFSELTRSDFIGITALATIGMVVGMSVLVWGVGHANVGIVTTLSAIIPVLILPGLWITTKQRPAFGAWIGAILVVIGAALIVLSGQ